MGRCALLALAFLFCLTSAACKSPEAGPVAVGASADAADANAEVDAEIAEISVETVGDTAVAAPEVDGDVSADLEAEDSAVDAATDATKTGPPYPCATELIPGLPVPGQACATLGQRRCTDVGSNAYVSSSTQQEWTCYRPNYVECVDSGGGKLGWSLKMCIDLAKMGATASEQACLANPSCIEQGGAATCPNSIVIVTGDDVDSYVSATEACPAALIGKTRCQGKPFECQKFQNGAFQITYPKATIKPAPGVLGACAKFAEGGSYWMPVYDCSANTFTLCGKTPDKFTKAVCDVYDGTARCSETCKEALDSRAKQGKPNPP